LCNKFFYIHSRHFTVRVCYLFVDIPTSNVNATWGYFGKGPSKLVRLCEERRYRKGWVMVGLTTVWEYREGLWRWKNNLWMAKRNKSLRRTPLRGFTI
jgi:hypothetical protein